MESIWHLITAMRDRSDRIASVLWAWLEQHDATVAQLAEFLGCDGATLERLALLSVPRPGPDWADDVEIIAISLRLNHDALHDLLTAETAREREFGA